MSRLFFALGLAFFLNFFATVYSDSCLASSCKCRDGEKQKETLFRYLELFGFPYAFLFGLTAIFPSSFQVETVEMASLVREIAT